MRWFRRKTKREKRLLKAQQQYAIPPEIKFDTVVNDVRDWCEFAQRDETVDPIDYLDFVIDAIADDVRISAITEPIYCGIKNEPRDWRDVFSGPFVMFTEHYGKIEFSGKTIISSLWDSKRIYKAATHIKRNGFIDSANYFTGLYIPEWRLIVVREGLHHTGVAAQNHCICGECRAGICRLEKMFDAVTTDGEYWYYDNRKAKVRDVRIAILFEVAREKDRLLKTNTKTVP